MIAQSRRCIWFRLYAEGGRYRSPVLTLREHNFRRDTTPQLMDAHHKRARTLRNRVACGQTKKSPQLRFLQIITKVSDV